MHEHIPVFMPQNHFGCEPSPFYASGTTEQTQILYLVWSIYGWQKHAIKHRQEVFTCWYKTNITDFFFGLFFHSSQESITLDRILVAL